MDHNWNKLDPIKAVRILKTIFEYFLWSGISNTSIFKMCDVLHWVDFLIMKTFSNILYY